MASPEKERNPVNVKYIVLGVCAVVFMLLFREPLSHLIERATEVKVTKEGVEIKTVNTPVGQAQVSAVSVMYASVPEAGIHGQSYVDTRLGFQISWPGDGNWTADEHVGNLLRQQIVGLPPTAEIPIVILRNEPVGNYKPNVNVIVQPAEGKSIRQWIDEGIQEFRHQQATVLSSSLDEATQGAFVVSITPSFGRDTYHLQRFAVAAGRLYIVSAGQLPPDNELSQNVRENLRTILNSFRIIK